MVVEMVKLVEGQSAATLQAFSTGNKESARELVAADITVNSLQEGINKKAVELIAKREPVAADVRHVLSILRIANELDKSAILRRISASAFWPLRPIN